MSTDKKAGQSLFTSLFSDSSATQNQSSKSNQVNQDSTETSLTENKAIKSSDSTQKPSETVSSLPTTSTIATTPLTPTKPKEIRTVDVFIGGATYPINCPVDEKDELDKAVLYINHFFREIRKDAPTLEHENLLVLCCLNMYEEMKQQKNTEATIRENDKQMQTLIEKITKDAKSIVD